MKNPPKVIFTTAFRKYAVEGFELDAVDYLLKPISFERFIKAVNKVMQTQMQSAGEPVEISDSSKDGAFIYFRADRKMVKVFLKDILYVESLKDYIKIITSFRQIITKQSISSLESMLPANQFVRIHRSYLVAINKIDSFTADDIEIQKKEIPIGRMYQHEVNRVLKLAVK
ncbi:Sensory transduction protein LytR [compost metagenome]